MSAPSHRHKMNKNREKDTILIDTGIEKKSFLMIRKTPLCSGCGFGMGVGIGVVATGDIDYF